MANGAAHEQPRDVLGGAVAQGSHASPSTRCEETLGGAEDDGGAQAEDLAKASWRTRAGAIGGGVTASLRGWRIVRMASPCVMAAMMRSVPCWQNGQRAISSAKTRFSSRAQLQRGDHVSVASSSSTPAGGAWG